MEIHNNQDHEGINGMNETMIMMMLGHNNPTFLHGIILTFVIYGMTIACHVLLPGRHVVGYVCSDDPRKHDILMYKLNGISTCILTIVMIILLLHMYLVLLQEGFTWRYLHVLLMTWWSTCNSTLFKSWFKSSSISQSQQPTIRMDSPFLYITKCRLGLLMGSQLLSLCMAHYFYRRGKQWNQKHIAPKITNTNTNPKENDNNTRQYSIRALSRDQVTRSNAFLRTIRKGGSSSHHHHPYQSLHQQRRQSRRQMWHDFYAGMGEFNPRTVLQYPPSSSPPSPYTTSTTFHATTISSSATTGAATTTISSTTPSPWFSFRIHETIDWKVCIVQCQTIMTQLLVLSLMMTARIHQSYNHNMYTQRYNTADNHNHDQYVLSSSIANTKTTTTNSEEATQIMTIMIVGVLQMMTVLWTWQTMDYMFHERTYLYSQDICSERLGFKLLWTRLGILPFLSTMSMWDMMNLITSITTTTTMTMNQLTNRHHQQHDTIVDAVTSGATTSAAATTTTTILMISEQQSIFFWSSLLYFIGWCITRGTLYQKYIFKTRPTQTTWLIPPSSSSLLLGWLYRLFPQQDFFQQRCIYTRPKQQQHDIASYNNTNHDNDVPRQLLKSGFWGMARHFHSCGTILQAIALSVIPMILLLRTNTMSDRIMTTAMMINHDINDVMNNNNNNSGDTSSSGTTTQTTTTATSTLLWLYPAWILWFSIHRQIKDDAMCRIRYGNDAWDEYCELVPYRIIPYVY